MSMEKIPKKEKLETEEFKKFLKKQKVKEDLKYEPLKYVLEIANVESAKQLVDKLSEFETKAGFEKVFERLEKNSDLEKIKIVFKDLNYLGDMSPEKNKTDHFKVQQ